ncbi:ComEC/Rec2 family competence protein [Patescibacteria group bacterium]
MREIETIKKPVFWLTLFFSLIVVAIWQWPTSSLHLIICDVGQGDSALITYQNTQILIDGGPNSQVLDCLGEHLPFWDREIEMVINSHPDSDHLSGLIDVIERYRVRYFILNSVGKDSEVFREFQQLVEAEGARVYFPQKGDRLKVGLAELAILWPLSQQKVLGATTLEREINETSIVFQLTYGQFDALFPGDISSEIESQLDLTDIEVLKVPHHGSKYSTSQEFLEKIDPELAVISVGKNSFGHPTEEVLKRLSDQVDKILRTDQEGEIEIVTDGEGWGVRK